ncbi:subtilase family protein [Mobilisporobacter senegalensis]|uniref:Subtilase family protein n=1 Tax=Mobilisporobacter senegalensis TaxID=1329262 RepID=A0A3N1XTV9_9FIRM|nr:S8 family peptidase [Mobilisporobacter senegalensis]ROR28307.1 subtilase family protein [Mobilisporobacter senegalensis]
MDSGKVSNDLNLALDVNDQVREKSADLNVGYIEEDNSWELIVKYSGDINRIREEMQIQITELISGYATVTIPQSRIAQFISYPEIEFVEKPRRLTFAVSAGRAASCINPVQTAEFDLFGDGVLVAIIDSGIDYTHPDFRNEDGTSRILDLWDQTIPGTPPIGYTVGTLYTKAMLDEALSRRTVPERLEIVPSVDISGHGTHVAGIACGNGRASAGRNRGVAARSEMLVVKLGSSVGSSFPRTTRLMEAVDFVIKRAISLGRPIAVNISFGNNYGSHDGNSILETFLDEISGFGRTCICVGSGNEGGLRHHVGGTLVMNQPQTIELAVGPSESTLSVQIWKNFFDDFDIELRNPNGELAGPIQKVLGTQRFILGNTGIYLYYGEPTPTNMAQEIYIEFIPINDYIDVGTWNIRLIPRIIVNGRFDMWLPSGEVITPTTGFLQPTEEITLTIPSTAMRVITVGAYNAYLNSFSYFSGRGYTRYYRNIKPDLVAPGVNITSAAPGGGYTSMTGTSMATPFVTGSAALMMQWGIVEGNDPYLYGEKVKAYLIAGTRKLDIEPEYPNPRLGYGALCLRESFRWARRTF